MCDLLQSALSRRQPWLRKVLFVCELHAADQIVEFSKGELTDHAMNMVALKAKTPSGTGDIAASLLWQRQVVVVIWMPPDPGLLLPEVGGALKSKCKKVSAAMKIKITVKSSLTSSKYHISFPSL